MFSDLLRMTYFTFHFRRLFKGKQDRKLSSSVKIGNLPKKVIKVLDSSPYSVASKCQHFTYNSTYLLLSGIVIRLP